MAWVDTGSGFPGAMVESLFTANFTTAGNFNASTNVNVSAIDVPTGFSFSSSSATIAPLGVPTPTPMPTPTPGGPTPTPTATPSGDTAVLDIDHDGEVRAFSDGLLVLRYLIGFRGTDLTNGVVDTVNCNQHCTAVPIQNYIQSILLQLDIDNDGETRAFSDGLLALRYLIGFRGTDLTNGVVDTINCVDRCTAVPIQNYLLGLSTP
jgi:hypothetical protein